MAEEITGINNEKPNKKQYVVKVPGEQDVAYWDEDKYNSLKDKLFSKYEDAEVTEFSEYDPESSVVSDSDRFTISIPGEEGVAHWDAEKFSRMKDRLLEKYPDARIGVEHDATDDYWAPQAEEARKAKEALDAFESDKERGGFIRKYSNMSDAADAIESEAWNRENDFAKFVDSDDNKSKYGSLKEEREALRASYFGNPYVIRQERTAARKATDLRDDYQRRAKQAQTGAEKNDWKRAAKMQNDIRKILEAPNRYDEDTDYGNGFVQYMQGARDTFSDKDFYTRGVTSIARNFDLRGISKKLQKIAAEKGGSLTDEDIDNILTNSEKAELESFINLSRVQEERAEAITGAYRAGQGFAESTGFMAEFLLSYGLANVAGKAMSGSSNAIARYLGRQLMSERALARAVEKGVTTVPKMSKAKALTEEAVVKPLVQGLWHTGTQISTLDTISEGLLDTDNSGQLVSVGHAIFDGIIDSVVENWSESVGGALEMGMAAPFRLAGKAGGTIGKTGFGRFARWLYEAKPTQILKEAGFNGMLGEIAEEWAGNAVRVGINKVSGGEMGMTPEQFGDFASFEQQLEMAASFAPMTLIGASSATISALKDRSRYNGLVGNVKDIMRGQGVSEEEIQEVFDTRFDTAEDVGKKFAPYLKAVSDKAQDPAYKESAGKDYRTMLDLAKEIGIGQIVDEMDRLQKDEAKESLRKDIESVAGQFWMEHDSPEARDENGNPVKIQEVKVIRYADGRQKYIVGEDNGTYLTIDQDGRPGFINDEKREEGREDGSILSDKEMLLDDYLREEMEARKIGSEAARMQDERRQMVSEAQKALPVGTEIDRGTPENPKLFVVMAVSPNGVHLERGEGEEFEQEDITWGEAAESLGMQAPMTDAEIEQQEAKTYKENESRKDDYNATLIPGTEINVPIESADETPEMVSYRFQRAILDDGQVIFEVMDKETGENTTITEQQAMEGDLAAILASAREKSQEQPEVEETVEEPAEDALPLFESGPKAGQVNQQKLWQDNPERWAQWNDDRRQDNGTNTRQYVATAISKLESDISEMQKKHDAELDFDKRENMEGTIGDLQNRLARISAIAKRYDDAERAARDAEVARRNAEMQEQIAKKREEEERKKAQLQQNISSDEQFKAIQKRFAEADKEQGAADELVFGGEQFKGHYYLMEAETPTASHNATEGWTPTAGFPMDETGRSLNTRDYEHEKESQDHVLNTAKDYDSRAIQHMVVVTSDGVVISGNERTMASQIAAKNNSDGKYIDYLSRHAERYGFTPEQVSRFSHPRVVFVPDEAQPYTAKLFDLFNKSEEKRQNVVATAAKVAKITDERLIMRIADLLYDISDINNLYQTPSMVSALMNILIDGKVITREDLPMYLDAEGKLTGAGEDFVESVLFGSIFSQSDDAVRAAMSDKSVRRSIVFAFPTLVRIRNLSGDYSIISEMTEAVSLLAEAKAANNGKAEGAVEDYMNQAQLFSEDLPVHKATVQLLAGVLNDKRYGSLRAVLDQYINRAESADSGQLELLSGDVESKEQILRDILSFNNINIETYDNSGSSEDDKVRDSAPEQGVGGTGTDTAGEERLESAPTEGSDTGGEGRGEEQVEEEPAAEEAGESEQPDLFQQEPEEIPTQQEEIAAAEAVVDTEPTDAQKEAGNYRKGHVTIDGYDYTIENPKGSVRSGKDASGKEWSQVMNNTYGYIRGTEGVDGDHIDMFISDNPEQGNVYVVDQIRPKVVKSISADNIRRIYADVQAKKYKGVGSQNLRSVLLEANPDMYGEDRTATEKLIDAAEAERGNALADDILASVKERQDGTEFDEHKVMYGFNSEEEARAAYLSNYEEGWQGLGNITGVSKDEFRKWIESSHRKTKPFAEYASVKPIEEEESAPSEQPEDSREYGPFTSMVEQARKEMEDEASRKAAEERIAKWKSAIGDVFEVVNSLDEVKEEEARRQIEEADKSIRNGISADDVAVKGWFRPSTGKAYLYLPHIMQTDSPEKNIDKTILHEVISHKGLRNLLGEEKFNSLLDKVWDIMPEDTRSLFLSYVGNGFSSEQERQRAAADECLAHAAEENEDIIKDLDKNFWTKIADFIKGLIEDMVGMDIWNGEKGWLAKELEESYRAFVREARQNAESRLDNAEEGSLFAEGERTKAVDTAKAEASPQSVISNTREKYEDFGEKIGLARKDTAVSGFKKKTGGESLPSWRQKYKVAEVTIIPEDQRTPYGAPFELKPREIGASEFDYSKPFVAYYIEKKTHRGYTRERYNFIKDTDRNIIIFSSKEQFEATVPVYEAREQGYRVRESGGKFVIIRPASNGKLVEYASFDSKEEAVTYLTSPEGCASLLNRKRENYELPALEEITRIGMKDYRDGKDITPDDMLETFGFRGGEFGNWLNAEERQQFLNVSYDSLMDLSEITGISPKALSLGGELSIAFGARGRQGAKAHFEPTKNVINLTKMNGAGSLAHEWAHAFDNYFGMMDAKSVRNRDKDTEENFNYLSQGSSWRKGARTEIREAFRNVMSVLTRKSVTRQISIDESQERVDRTRRSYERSLKIERDNYARGITRYVYNRKTKQREETKTIPTAEQLAEFDRLVPMLLTDPTFTWEYNFGKDGYRAAGEVAEKLYDLVKDVYSNKKGSYGPLHNLFMDSSRLAADMKRLEEAKAGTEETVIVDTDVLKDSKWFDRGMAGNYFSKDIEMFARAFENYISGKLKDSARSSDYLTYEKGSLYMEIWGHSPYPIGEERAAVEKAFDGLMSSLMEKNEDGKQLLFSRSKKKAPETAVPGDESPFKATVISSADGTKILNNLEKLAIKCEKLTRGQKRSFLKDIAVALNAEKDGSESKYATFVTKNNITVTIRLSDHNATVSNFDDRGELNGISIVISRKPNSGIIDDGNAHIVEFFYSDKALKKADNSPYSKIVQSLIQSLYSGEYNDMTGLAATTEVNGEQGSGIYESENGILFSKVTDPALLDRLNSEETLKVYRAMQLIDGNLYPPMSAKVNGEMREPTEIGDWEQADENPELADDKGYFKLDKGNKKSLKARYNPYFHTSRSPLNDQFSEAMDRPNLVIVEVEIPASELTSGYKAYKAKDAVGEMTWHAGPVSGKLPEGKKRKVILSRWAKVIRILPDSEVADRIAELLSGEEISIPMNTVTPSLREELEKRGVKISEDQRNIRKSDVRSSKGMITPEQDKEYLAAVESGDMEKAKKMVKMAARKAGYTTKGYHGSIIKGFNVFDDTQKWTEAPDGSYWFAKKKKAADSYRDKDGETREMYLKMDNPLVVDADGMNYDELPNEYEVYFEKEDGSEIDETFGTYEEALRFTTQNGIDENYINPVGVTSVNDYARRAMAAGYDGLVIKNVTDIGMEREDNSSYEEYITDDYAVFSPSQIKSAEPVVRDDEGNVIPLSERFNPENNDIRFSKAEEARFSITDEDGNDIRYTTEGGLPDGNRLSTLVERTYRENGAFSFMGKDKIETAGDVAYIFKELETAAVENSFIVYVKDGIPTILHTGIGNSKQVMIDEASFAAGMNDFAPDEVYMVHNHPSGRVEASRADISELEVLQRMAGTVPVKGVIIDTLSGEYGYYDSETFLSTLIESRNKDNEGTFPLKVMSFDKLVFSPDYAANINKSLVKGPEDVASYLSAHRLGEGRKIGALLVDHGKRVVGNMVLNENKISADNAGVIARQIVNTSVHCAADGLILFGDFPLDMRSIYTLKSEINSIGGKGISLMDIVRVEGNHTRSLSDGTLDDSGNSDIRFSMANINERIFISNAEKAVEGIKMEKATPEQWLKMIEKNGGLKAGEDKWIGLSEWLNTSKKKTLTKQEVLDYIRKNEIQIEEVSYVEEASEALRQEAAARLAQGRTLDELQEEIELNLRLAGDELEGMDESDIDEWLMEQMTEKYGDEFSYGYYIEDGRIEYNDDSYDVDVREFNHDNPDTRIIHPTRLQYTTDGLDNKREIALTVPTIEPWNAKDDVHFGEAGEGRAVAWVRFGDAVIGLNGRALFIDEIQSKRHQDAREDGGYKDLEKLEEAKERVLQMFRYYGVQNIMQLEEAITNEQHYKDLNEYKKLFKAVPAAPFEKNWHELAMKRMLRLAAEEGYDYMVWTTGEQQAERYDIGNVVEHIRNEGKSNGLTSIVIRLVNGDMIAVDVDDHGEIKKRFDSENRPIELGEYHGKKLGEIIGKELAVRVLSLDKYDKIEGDGLRIGGEGMKGFYDEILPRFMNKYSKKWGVQVEDKTLYDLGDGPLKVHAVRITPEMKESVMQGQLMFSKGLYNPRANIAPVRGGWTKDKIKKRIHGALTGHKNAARLISEFDSPQELKEHMFYHGTVHGSGALKPSILFNDRDLEFYGGGGYGERYWGISLTKDKYVATAFSGTSRSVRVYPVVLAKGANVLDGQGKYTDAGDLEDDIEKLWADGVDAVWIGGGEQELCVLNPRAICNVDYPSLYEVYGLRRDKVKPLTDEEIERLYEYAKSYYETRIPRPPKVGMPKRYDSEKREWNKDYFEQYRNWENEYKNSDEYKQFRKQEEEAIDKIRFSRGVSDIQKSGLPSVIGPENVTDFYSSLFTLASPEIREAISRRAISNGFDFEKATGDYISELVENGIENDETGYLRAAAGILEGFIGRPVDENSLLYMLWRSANEVSESRPLTVASDISMQRRLGVGEYGNDIRFSKGIRDVAEENIVQEEKAVDAAEENLKETRKAAKKSLLTVYQAMQGQKTYDKAVVDALVSYTRSILKGGEINRLSAREIGRLLGFITHSTGATARSVKKNADALLDMLIDVILKNESDALEDMLAVKGNKVNATGVEVQGRLDVRGQNVLKAIREGINMIGEEDGVASAVGIQEALNEIENKDLFSSDDSVRKAAEDRHAGLTLARQYGDTIRTSEMEEDGLLSEKKQAATDLRDKNLTRTAYSELIADIDNALRENHIERIEAIQSLRTSVKGIIEGSVQAAADFREKEANRINEIHHLANSDMQGLSANEHVRNGESGTMDKIVNSSAVRLLTQPLATFDQMLRLFGRKSASGEGYLWNKFMRGFVDARDRQIEGTESANSELDRKVSDVFGQEMRWNDLIALESSMPKAVVTFMDGGEKKSHTLSQGNLLYIYMVNKMSDGRMKLRKMGIEQEDVDAIKAQMDPRFIKIADWVQSEFLKERRNRYNAVHERLFGSSMAAIENYFPLKINARSRYRSVDIGEEKDENAKPATTTGGIIKRVRNTTALDLLNADAFAVVKDHVEEMEQWAAFAEYNRDINTLLSYRRFRNKVEGMTTIYGAKEKLWKNFENTARIAGGVYHPSVDKHGSDSAAVNLAKGVTMAKINFRLYTALKQILSLPAFLPDANVAYIARDIINPRAAWIWATENLPMLRERLRSRQAGDTRLMTTDKDWKIWQSKVMKMASSIGMAPNAFVDALAISIGAHAIYSTRYDRYIKDGFSEEKAERKAKQDAAVLYNESQQSNENAFLSTIQLDRTWFSATVSVFRNSSFGYQRQLHDALRNLARRMKDGYREESIASMMKQMMRDGLAEGQAQHAAERAYNREVIRSLTRVAVFGVGLEMFWNLGSHLVYLLFGDDDDKKNEMLAEDIFRGLVAGPLEGLTGGNVISELINMLHKGENLSSYDPTLMPIVSDIKRMMQMFGNDKPAAWNELINIATQAITGVNPQTFTDTVVAIVDACGGDMETSREVMVLLMRIAQVPQSQVDEIYIDELGMSAGKAKGLSYRKLAERYARYKINKKAPLTFWAYTDEAEERREKAYLKSFKKKVNERNKQ